jgi:hypothetical protein
MAALYDSSIIDIPELKTNFLFRRQPVAIPADLRPIWRIGLIVLLLNNCCKGGRTSFARLHVLNWGIRSKKNRHDLQAVIKGVIAPDAVIVRFEPFLNRAVDFAIGEGLVRLVDGKNLELSTKGRELAINIHQIESLYTLEKQFMEAIRNNLTESLIKKMFA